MNDRTVEIAISLILAVYEWQTGERYEQDSGDQR